jgi:hypothetical protein
VFGVELRATPVPGDGDNVGMLILGLPGVARGWESPTLEPPPPPLLEEPFGLRSSCCCWCWMW